MKKEEFKQVKIKSFIVQFFIIALLFITISNVIINSIKSNYYDHIKRDSLNLASSYSHSFSKSIEATSVVNELLEQKIMVGIKTTAFYNGSYSNTLFEELANILEVDEIDYYNSNGEIVYSNIEEFIGWKVFTDHPIDNFMKSDRKSLIEEIRQDTISGDYYKYGYIKISNGGLIQIGVRADKIYNFLGKFEMQRLLDELKGGGVINRILFIDNDFNILENKDSQNSGQVLINNKIKNLMLTSKEYGFINNYNGEDEYIVIVPVYFKENKIGTLVISQPLDNIENIIKQVSTIILVALIIIYALITYSMVSSYKKNKNLIGLAYFDMLTNLPNKQYLKEVLSDDLKKTGVNDRALFLINCRNFRIINLMYGYEYGDEFIKELSILLKKLTAENCNLFQFSFDRFVFYLKSYNGDKELTSMINRINEIFNKPLKVRDIEQNIGVQIGIVKINNIYKNFDQILKEASISLSQIKYNDSVNYVYFNEIMENKLKRVEIINREIRKALSENNTQNIYLEYHPLIDLKTNLIIGFEVLARMKSEKLGQISPIEFIDVAEKNQLIVNLGNLILTKACIFLRRIMINGFEDIKVAVNISGIQLLRDDFINIVTNTINETRIKALNLELEITESVFLEDYKVVNEKLKILRENSIKIILDDFGTGYSSLSRLRELNIDTVKIDKYFISKISYKESKELLVGDIISMAHKIGLKVVAEGVEEEQQRNYLCKMNCDIMQGYLFSKPLSDESAIELLKSNYQK